MANSNNYLKTLPLHSNAKDIPLLDQKIKNLTLTEKNVTNIENTKNHLKTIDQSCKCPYIGFEIIQKYNFTIGLDYFKNLTRIWVGNLAKKKFKKLRETKRNISDVGDVFDTVLLRGSILLPFIQNILNYLQNLTLILVNKIPRNSH